MIRDEITQIETLDTARIVDVIEGEWTLGWLKVYKRHRIIKSFDLVSVSTSEKVSDAFYCAPYSEFLLEMNLVIPGVASVLIVDVELSDDQSNWFKLRDEEVKNILFDNADGSQKVCLSGKCIAPYMRLKAIATAGTWTVSAKTIYIS